VILLLERLKRRLISGNNELGMTLVEILVALAILGITAVAFLSGAATALKAVIITQERVAAESLAKSEIEYIKSLDYGSLPTVPWSYGLPSDPPEWDLTHALPPGYDGYSIEVDAEFTSGHTGADDIQKLIVTVEKDGRQLLEVEDYKVDR